MLFEREFPAGRYTGGHLHHHYGLAPATPIMHSPPQVCSTAHGEALLALDTLSARAPVKCSGRRTGCIGTSGRRWEGGSGCPIICRRGLADGRRLSERLSSSRSQSLDVP